MERRSVLKLLGLGVVAPGAMVRLLSQVKAPAMASMGGVTLAEIASHDAGAKQIVEILTMQNEIMEGMMWGNVQEPTEFTGLAVRFKDAENTNVEK